MVIILYINYIEGQNIYFSLVGRKGQQKKKIDSNIQVRDRKYSLLKREGVEFILKILWLKCKE